MRVIGGVWRGRPLRAPSGCGTRPTSDRVREAVFDVLAALPEVRAVTDRALGAAPSLGASPSSEVVCSAGRPGPPAAPLGPLAGHVVLDLFAGSGALGIEALSRAAAACTFVEAAPAALRALRQNLERLGEGPPRVRILAGDARRTLAADAARGSRYTLVFVDPPYDAYWHLRASIVALLEHVLAPGAVVVVESAAGTPADLPWTVVREKRYGDTRVTFLTRARASQS